MTRTTTAAIASCLSLLALAGTAPAASPVKGATYTGHILHSDTPAKVKLKVSSTGRRLTFVISCYGNDAVRKKRVPIDADGKFVVTVLNFRATGTFVRRSKAKGRITYGSACFSQPSARWSATKS
jgi:hypothetical protein